MGLCQAVQGNYRMAVASFRRAVALAPSNPWYNHNLGHLLAVALDAPSEALVYLRKAHSAQPGQEGVGKLLWLHGAAPLVCTGGVEGTVRVWDARTGGCVLERTGHAEGILDLAQSPDGRAVASASDDGTARVFDLAY